MVAQFLEHKVGICTGILTLHLKEPAEDSKEETRITRWQATPVTAVE